MNIPAGASYTYQAQGALPFSNPAIQGVIDQLNLNIQSSDSQMVTNSSATGSSFLSSVAQALDPFAGGPEFQMSLTMYNASGSAVDSLAIQAEIDSDLQAITGNPVVSSISGITGGNAGEQAQTPGTTQNVNTGVDLSKILPGSTSLFLIAVVVILVVAIVLAPETPARVAKSFA